MHKTNKFIAGICFAIACSLVNAAQIEIHEKELVFSDYNAKLFLVDFWASWCAPCRSSLPFFTQMQKKYADKGLQIIGINLDADLKDAHKFLADIPVEFPVYSDKQGKLATQYGVVGMPQFFLLTENGEIVKSHIGFRVSDQESIEKLITEALSKSRGGKIQ